MRLWITTFLLVPSLSFGQMSGASSGVKDGGSLSVTNHVPNQSLAIPAGLVPGKSSVNKFGRNAAIAAGTTEDIWDGSALYSFPATALMTSISQTANQAAMTGQNIEIQGLNAGWTQVVQTVVLDASSTTNPVALGTPLIRAFRMKVLANVVGDSPIRLHNAAESQDYAIIGVGNNQTLMAIYTVPAGKTAYMASYYVVLNPATNQDPTSMQMRMWAKDNAAGYERQLKHTLGVAVGGHFQHGFDPYYKFTEKTDIYLDGAPVGKVADISAGFDLILIDN